MKASIAAIKSIKLQEDMIARLIRIEEKLDLVLSGNAKAGKEQKAATKKVEAEKAVEKVVEKVTSKK